MKGLVAPLLGITLAGCGLYPPQHHEFWASDVSTTYKVANIAAQVKCELARGVQALNRDGATWINSWGALVTFTLDTTEKTTLVPGLSFNRPLPTAITSFPGLEDVKTDQIFKLGIGAQLSSEAQRKGGVVFFYTAQELRKMKTEGGCVPSVPAEGFLFLESALNLDRWLYSTASLQTTGLAVFPTLKAEKGYLNQNAITETIKFDVVSSGNATPSWKLVRISANENTTLFEGRRERSQQIDIAFGPLEAAPGTLAASAQAQFNAQAIATAVSRRLGQ
jgi:hypothetical protein